MKHTIIAALFAGVVGLAAGYYLGAYGPFVRRTDIGSADDPCYQAGWEAARQRLVDQGILHPVSGNNDVRVVSGVIKEVIPDGFLLAVMSAEPLSDPALDTRTVIFNKSTMVVTLRAKPEAEYQNEYRDYIAKDPDAPYRSDSANPPPLPHIEEIGGRESLRAGQRVVVNLAGNANGQVRLAAEKIVIQP